MRLFTSLFLMLGVGCITSHAASSTPVQPYPWVSTHQYPVYASMECLELQEGWPCVYKSEASRDGTDFFMRGFDRSEASRGTILVAYTVVEVDQWSHVRLEFHQEGRYSMRAPPGVSVILFEGYADANFDDMDGRDNPPIIEVFIGGDPLLGTKLPRPGKYFESYGPVMTIALVTFPEVSNDFSLYFTATRIHNHDEHEEHDNHHDERYNGEKAEQLSYIIGGSIGGVVIAGLVGVVVVTRNRNQLNHAVSSFSAVISPHKTSRLKKEPEQMFSELNSDNPLYNKE